MNAPAADTVARHAYGWLVAANAVGVLLAALLLWPQLNTNLSPFTYGRWMPLHMDWQLYGWCSLPLIGVLFIWMLPAGDDGASRQASWAVRIWSAALVLGGVSWLAGTASGKLFLDWSSWARWLLPLAMVALWCVLAFQSWRSRTSDNRLMRLGRGAFLLVLALVPPTMYFASGPEVFPSVNPDTGGATGTSLLGSTLGIVAIGGLLPHLLRLEARPGIVSARTRTAFWILYLASALLFAFSDHGNASHHSPSQIVALGTLMLWGPMLCLHFRQYAWTASARRWLRASAVWWCALLATGWLSFLPEISERLKFTHGLVAHAHLALAGLITSMGAVILSTLGRPPGGGAPAFWGWQLACAAHIAVLIALGGMETSHAADFFTGAAWISILLAARLAAGIVMFAASAAWLKGASS